MLQLAVCGMCDRPVLFPCPRRAQPRAPRELRPRALVRWSASPSAWALCPAAASCLSSVLMCLSGCLPTPIRKMQSSECLPVPRVPVETSSGTRRDCGRAEGLRGPGLLVSGAWWTAKRLISSAGCGAGRSCCGSSSSAASGTSGSGTGAFWAPSFQWRVRDGQVTGSP